MRQRRVVALNAHPDDEALLSGGTLASLAARGHRVVLVTATDGGAGMAPAALLPDLASTRLAELRRSAAALGAADVIPLGYADSGHLGEVPPDPPGQTRFVRVPVEEAATRVAEVLRAERADLLLGYDREGGYHHRDHVHVHHVARAAAATADVRLLEATAPRETLLRVLRVAERVSVLPNDLRPEDWARAWTPRAEITHRVDVRPWLDAKLTALRAHASQTGGDSPRTLGAILALPRPVRRAALGHEHFVDPALPRPRRRADVRHDVLEGVA